MSLTSREVAQLAKVAMDKIHGGPSLFEQRLWAFAEKSPHGNKIITANVANDPYLLRIYLTPDRSVLRQQLRALGITNALALSALTLARPYLHHFFRGDEDREVHNHPWQRAVSVILTSGYKEFRWKPASKSFSTHYLKPGSINYIRRNDFHRVELYKDQGCWTLFTSIGRVMESNGRDWSFLNTETGELTPWGQWVQGE
jgi:hypothetical protein